MLTDGNEKDSSIDVHTCQGGDHSATSKQKLAADKDICDEGEDHEHQVGNATVSGVNDLEIGMASRGVLLDFACQDGEYENLHSRSCSIPERTCNPIRVSDLE